MAAITRKKLYGTVNLGLLEPPETLDPEELKLFSKEEISAYLQYYDIDISKVDSKPELKRLLRNLIIQVKAGHIAKREGIGSELKLPIHASIMPRSVATIQESPHTVKLQPSLHTPQPVHSAQQIRTHYAPLNRSPALGSSMSSSSAPTAGPRSQTMDAIRHAHSSESTITSSGVRPEILEFGVITQVQDYVAPNAVEKLKSTYPETLGRSSQFYDSLIPRHDHQQTVTRESLIPRSLEPPRAHHISETTCTNCGKRANKDCRFKRCRTCCHAGLLRCPHHMKDLTLLPGQVLTDRPSITSTTPSNAASIIPKPKRAVAPPVMKTPTVLLGEREAASPWAELGAEASFRAFQNQLAMQALFDPYQHSITSLQTMLNGWQSRPREPLEEALASTSSLASQMTSTHKERMDRWKATSDTFFEKLQRVSECQTQEEIAALKAAFHRDLQGTLPVPLTTRKRSATEDPPHQPPAKLTSR